MDNEWKSDNKLMYKLINKLINGSKLIDLIFLHYYNLFIV